ncbi:LysR family transcriptional regulator [Nocardioides ginsengisegetis]
MELRHVKALVAVSEELNFTRAAERLHLAQQALSHQIRQLEDEVGTQLFVRTTRKVELTPAGEVFLERVAPVLVILEEAKEVARQVALGAEGHLEIAYTYSLGIESLPLILDRLHEVAPQVTLTAAVTLTDQAVHGLLRGQFDLAVVRNPEPTPNLKSIVIREEAAGVVIGTNHPAAGKDVVDLEDLVDSTLVIWPRWHSPGYADKILRTFPVHRDEGRVKVYERFSHDGFMGDKGSYELMAQGTAFQVAFQSQYETAPEGFVWKPLRPELPITVEILRREGVISPAQKRFLEAARQVSRHFGWLTNNADSAAPSPPK